MAACNCCGSKNAQFGPDRAPDGLPVRQSVCHPCSNHLGYDERTVKRRERDHYEQYRYDLDEFERVLELKYARQIAQLEEEKRQLGEELEARPTQTVYRNLDQEKVWAAEEERSRAYIVRDAAFRHFAELRVLHHDTGRGSCSCRKPVSECKETKILNECGAFMKWEAQEVKNYREYRNYALPAGHPALTNPRWVQPAA
jgi:hypothetical protein